jgi:hypothetical protein
MLTVAAGNANWLRLSLSAVKRPVRRQGSFDSICHALRAPQIPLKMTLEKVI